MCKLLGIISAFLVITLTGADANAAFNGTNLVIPMGRSELVSLPRKVSEVAVANPNVADVYVHGRKKFSVVGVTVGETTIRAFDDNHNLIREINVAISYDLPSIRKALKTFFPNERIGLEMVNRNIALVGEVSDISVARQAVKIVSEFVVPSVNFDGSGNVSLVNVRNGGQDRERLYPILNLLKVSTGQQVLLRVRVGEIKRTALKNLGFNLDILQDIGATTLTIGTSNISSLSTFGTFGATYTSGGDRLGGVLSALEADGLFRTLSEPNLTSLSGEKAEFLAGGEFPVAVPQGDNTISIEYKPFGVAVAFVPYVLSNNRIRINVEPEVSEISDNSIVEIDGNQVPTINTRRVKTTVELAPGESFMIAGLIKDEVKSQIEQVPGAKELPILGALLRSTSYQRDETELVIAVTPYIVDPLKSSDVKLPTDDFRPASQMEMFMYGALASLTGNNLDVSANGEGLEGPVGYILD